jgi:hypothetical protein
LFFVCCMGIVFQDQILSIFNQFGHLW